MIVLQRVRECPPMISFISYETRPDISYETRPGIQQCQCVFKFAFPGKFLRTNRNVTDYEVLTNLPICNLFFLLFFATYFLSIL